MILTTLAIALSQKANVQDSPVLWGNNLPTLRCADSKTAALWAKVITTNSVQRTLKVSIETDADRFEAELNKQDVKVASKKYSWAFANNKLSGKLGKSAFSVASTRRKIPVNLRKAGINIDPLLMDWCYGARPLARYITPTGTVRWIGQSTIQKDKCDLFTVGDKSYSVGLAVRKKDNLIRAIQVVNKDGSGRVVSQSSRNIKYLKVGSTY